MLDRVSGFRRTLGYRPGLGRNHHRIEVTGLITDAMSQRSLTLFSTGTKKRPVGRFQTNRQLQEEEDTQNGQHEAQ